jgi:hypothetical protein
LNGSCAAAIVANPDDAWAKQSANGDLHCEKVWHTPPPTGPLMNMLLRHIANEAPRHRPIDPPDVLVVRLETPLAPPLDARIGDRFLPSAVLEMTPGFISQLIARCWGFAGPSLCMIGDSSDDKDGWNLTEALDDLGLVMSQIDLVGTGDKREIVWKN